VADASIPVDAEADAEEVADFRRFVEGLSPAALIRHQGRGRPDPNGPDPNLEETEGDADDDVQGHHDGGEP